RASRRLVHRPAVDRRSHAARRLARHESRALAPRQRGSGSLGAAGAGRRLMRKTTLAALVLLCALPGAALAAQSRARPLRLQAYLLSSAPDSLRDLRAHAAS